MVGLTDVAATVGILKTAFESLQVLSSTFKSDGKAQGEIQKLSSILMDAQQSAISGQRQLLELIAQNDALKKQIAAMEAWEAERQRYLLTSLGGVFVYALKSGHENGEPRHKLCTTCFQQGRKSILHEYDDGNGGLTLRCIVCKNDLYAESPDSSAR